MSVSTLDRGGRSASPGTGPLLHLDRVSLGYETDEGTNIAVGDVSFSVRSGERIMLLGRSGCGKSTLLKAIAGFLAPLSGEIAVSGRSEIEPGPDRAVVFQEFDQLFPWRTVRDNVAYPLRVGGSSRDEATASADRHLELLGLTEASGRYPHQLSGGMKQRTAIARALALEPLMLLMDEPFGSLDAQTRARLQRELRSIVERTGATLIFVTHSIQEALLLGDRIIVLGGSPSGILEEIDARAITDPDVEAVELRQRLRELLAGDEEIEHDVLD